MVFTIANPKILTWINKTNKEPILIKNNNKKNGFSKHRFISCWQVHGCLGRGNVPWDLAIESCFICFFLVKILRVQKWGPKKSSIAGRVQKSGQISSRPHTTDFPQMVVIVREIPCGQAHVFLSVVYRGYTVTPFITSGSGPILYPCHVSCQEIAGLSKGLKNRFHVP